jgi:hypothetical protein
MFERGRSYKRAFISQVLGGGVQDYLPHVDGRVVYGAFSLELNPQAPGIVLPGTGPEIERWARVFAEQEEAIPVFIKRRSNEWTYMGLYRCTGCSDAEADIELHAAKAGRDDISMVFTLVRARESEERPPSGR